MNTSNRITRTLAVGGLLALTGCPRPARIPVTFTQDAIRDAVCASVSGTSAIGTKPDVVEVTVAIAHSVGAKAGLSVTPVTAEVNGSRSATTTVKVAVNSNNIRCDRRGELRSTEKKLLFLDPETGVVFEEKRE